MRDRELAGSSDKLRAPTNTINTIIGKESHWQKAGPVPTQERLGPDDCENLQD